MVTGKQKHGQKMLKVIQMLLKMRNLLKYLIKVLIFQMEVVVVHIQYKQSSYLMILHLSQ